MAETCGAADPNRRARCVLVPNHGGTHRDASDTEFQLPDEQKEAAINLAFAVAQDALTIANRLRRATRPQHIRKAYEGIRAAHRATMDAFIPWEEHRG
jgi:hypothetical protein